MKLPTTSINGIRVGGKAAAFTSIEQSRRSDGKYTIVPTQVDGGAV